MKKLLSVLLCVSILLIAPTSNAEITTDLITLMLRYNLATTDTNGELSPIKKMPAPNIKNDYSSYTIELHKFAVLIAETKPETNDLEGLMLIGAGDGSLTSGMIITLTAGALFVAYGFVDSLKEVGDFMKKINFLGDDAFDGNRHKFVIDGHTINYGVHDGLGFTLFITP